MKKLTLGFALEQRKANCNFCGESDKDCVKGVLPDYFEYLSTTKYDWKYAIEKEEYGYAIDDWESGAFGGRKIKGKKCEYMKIPSETKYYKVVIEEKKMKQEACADICKDCVNQLYKLWKLK